MNLIDNLGKSYLTEFREPFNKDCITAVTFYVRIPLFKTEFVFESRVEFKSGNTSGEQKLEGKDLPDVLKKTEDFIKSL